MSPAAFASLQYGIASEICFRCFYVFSRSSKLYFAYVVEKEKKKKKQHGPQNAIGPRVSVSGALAISGKNRKQQRGIELNSKARIVSSPLRMEPEVIIHLKKKKNIR